MRFQIVLVNERSVHFKSGLQSRMELTGSGSDRQEKVGSDLVFFVIKLIYLYIIGIDKDLKVDPNF